MDKITRFATDAGLTSGRGMRRYRDENPIMAETGRAEECEGGGSIRRVQYVRETKGEVGRYKTKGGEEKRRGWGLRLCS